MDYVPKLAFDRSGDSRNSQTARILRDYKSRLEGMRSTVLYQMSQRRITQTIIDVMERDLSEMIGGIDKLRRTPNIEDLLSSPDELLAKVRTARKCLHLASVRLEKANSIRYIDSLFEKYEEFTDLLSEAIDVFDNV